MGMRSITPMSYIYLASLVFVDYTKFVDARIVYAFTVWMVIEALFLPYYLTIFNRFNSTEPDMEHFASNPDSRKMLVRNCLEAMKLASGDPEARTDPKHYIQKVVEGWFLNVPINHIKRENFASWCGWAFFGIDMDKMTAEEREENYEIVAHFEKHAGYKFEPGYTEGVHSARLTLDPVFATQRCFYFYSTIYCTNMIAHIALWTLGFRRRDDFSSKAQIIYHRPATKCSTPRSDRSSDSRSLPVVFVHGIGIGFVHYLATIIQLPAEVDVYLVEWPHVAHQITTSVPTAEETVTSLCGVLDADGHPQACFFAHSLGTVSVSWMLRHPEGCRRVASTMLVDPVTFLLCDPTVATTFVYNDPKDEVDFLMHYFVSRELFIANALSRHFNWSHNILFVEDLAAVDSKDEHAYGSEGSWIHENTQEESTSRRTMTRSMSKLSSSSSSSSSSSPSPAASVGKAKSKRKSRFIEDEDSEDGSSLHEVKHLQCNHTIIFSNKDSIVPVKQVGRYLAAKQAQGHTCFETVFFDGLHGEIFLYPKWCKYLSEKVRERCGLGKAF